jgi:hypothetical protein
MIKPVPLTPEEVAQWQASKRKTPPSFARKRKARRLAPLPEDTGAPLNDPDRRARVNRIERNELASAQTKGGRYVIFASAYDNGTVVFQGKFLAPRDDGSERESRAFTARDIDSLAAVALAIERAIGAIAADPSLVPPVPPIAPQHIKREAPEAGAPAQSEPQAQSEALIVEPEAPSAKPALARPPSEAEIRAAVQEAKLESIRRELAREAALAAASDVDESEGCADE